MFIIDEVPSSFRRLDLEKAKALPLKDKLDAFLKLKGYPETTWWYHNVMGRGSDLDLQSEDRLSFLRHLCFHDLYYFAKFILRRSRLREQPNREMAEKVMVRKNPGMQEWRLICEPRETYKTTLCTMAYATWLLVRDRNTSVLIYSETDQQAKTIYLTIKEEFEMNEAIQRIWGKFVSKRWNETHLYLEGRETGRRDPSLTHCGLDTSINGVHPDYALLDDLCSEQNTQSMEQRDKAWQQYQVLTPLVARDGLIQVVGTRWCPDDLIDRILVNERELFSVISIRSAEDVLPNGRLYGEDIGLNAAVLQQKKKMGMYRYSANYLNNPIPDAEQSLKMEWLSYFEGEWPTNVDKSGEERPANLRLYLSVDASWADKDSKSGKDPTAIIVVGFDGNGNVYILDIFNKRVPPEEVVKEIMDRIVKYKILNVSSEDVGTQKGINKFLEDERLKRGIWFTIDKIKHQQRSKANRIMGLSPLFESGSVHIRPTMKEFIEQYKNFSPHYEIGHDDILDALEMAVSKYRQVVGNYNAEEQEQDYEDMNTTYCDITGRA